MTYRQENWSNGIMTGGYQIVAGPPITFQTFDGNNNIITSRNALPVEIALYNGSISTQNTQTVTGNLTNHLNQIETWIAANPSGAILTAAQTLWVAQTLAGLIRLLLNELSTIGQAN